MIIKVLASCQQLILYNAEEQAVAKWPISTAKKGLGERRGSEMTPKGWHYIRVKIGQNYPINSVFVGRRPTGEIYNDDLAACFPHRDWILTRILWLSGLEPGLNRFGSVDTLKRYIYIHGCPDSITFDSPSSHGCIRMRNSDILELFDLIVAGTRVLITA